MRRRVNERAVPASWKEDAPEIRWGAPEEARLLRSPLLLAPRPNRENGAIRYGVARHTDAGAETLERVYWEKLILKRGLLFNPVPSDGGDSDGTRLRRERHARSH